MMKPSTLRTLQAAEKAIRGLAAVCHKDGPLYRKCPRSVAQVNRTAKWLLNAINRIHQELHTTTAQEETASS
jgi:hypothetical protein